MTKAERFEAWADAVGLSGKSREALKLMEVAGLTMTEAARQVGMAPSTASRARDRYQLGVCPCCGQKMKVEREEQAAPSR